MISSSAESLVSVAMLSEVRSRLGRDADNFIIAVGERIGAACTFDFDGGLEPFTESMNTIWKELGFGQTALILQDGALAIHHELPYEGQDRSVWSETLPLLIEGIYRSWFRHFSTLGTLARVSASGHELEFVFSE